MAELISFSARKKIKSIEQKIRWSANRNSLLLRLGGDFNTLFNAEMFTIFIFDVIHHELVSIWNSNNEDFRVPILKENLNGYAALNRKVINVKDAGDEKELSGIVSDLRYYGRHWNNNLNTAKKVLIGPIVYKNCILGVVEIMNRLDGKAFSWKDEQMLRDLTKTLGRILIDKDNIFIIHQKFKYIVEEKLVTKRHVNMALEISRRKNKSVENILMNSFRVCKKDIGESLSRFYTIPFADITPYMPVHGILFRGLKISFMRENVFMPIHLRNDKILVAIDNPFDGVRIGKIKSIYKGKQIQFFVALKEGILNFLGCFYHEEKPVEKQSKEDPFGLDELLEQLEDDWSRGDD
ncbi:MAG: hypothetical protein H8E17_17345 [Deltaproteobacteria bacterium]|nr:hypothetical protein [Deltaproteobacteria bacterium]